MTTKTVGAAVSIDKGNSLGKLNIVELIPSAQSPFHCGGSFLGIY